ncbi:MAG: DUF2975 domain-containing protein [Pseudomonadota bacterium]
MLSTGLTRLARILSPATLLAAALLAALWLLLLLNPAWARAALGAADPNAGDGALRLAVLLGGLVSGTQIWCLWQMRGLFALYGRGAVLTSAAARRIRATGIGLALLLPITLLTGALQSVVLSWGAGPGQRTLSVTISGPELAALGGGLLLILVGAALAEAVALAEENRSFV